MDPHLVNTLLALVYDLGGLDARLAGSLADATTLRFSLGSTLIVAFSDGTNTEVLVTVSLLAGACGCVVEMPHLRLQTRMSSSSVTTFVTPHAGNVDMDFQGSLTVRWPEGTFTGGDIWFSPTASMLARATLSLAASVIDVLLSLAMMSRTRSPLSPSSLSSRSSPSSSTDSWRSDLLLDSDSLSLVTSGPNLEPYYVPTADRCSRRRQPCHETKPRSPRPADLEVLFRDRLGNAIYQMNMSHAPNNIGISSDIV